MPDILIIEPSSFGDIIHGLQVATSIRSQLPEARISWVVAERFTGLVERCEAVDHVFVFHRRGGWREFYALLRGLRSTKFDVVIDMQGLARSGVMTLATRARRKMGRSDAREGARVFYTECTPLPGIAHSAHAVDVLLQFLPMLGLKGELCGDVAFRDSPVPHGVSTGEDSPLILFPSSRRAEKNWQGFSDLTDRLLEAYPSRQVVWAGDAPAEGNNRRPAGRFLNLTGKTGLGEVIGLVGNALLVVANDSGPAHLAAACGVPVVVLFGPTDPRRFGPYPPDRSSNRVLSAPGGDLQRLTVDAVLSMVTDCIGTENNPDHGMRGTYD